MSIRKRTSKEGKVSYQVTVEGVRGPNGERKRFSKTVRTKKEALAAELEMQNQLNSGGIQRFTPMTIKTWVTTWLAVHKPNIEATTRAGYEEKLRNYVIPALGHIPINNLDATTIQNWVNTMRDQGLAPRTIKNAYQCLHSSLKKAVQLKMLPYNPCEGVVLPKVEEYNAEILSDDEIKATIEAAKGTSAFLMVFLCLAVGVRRGELNALKWQHIDLDKGKVHIVDNRVAVKGGTVTKGPKSKSSKRTITIGPSICEVLKTAKAEYDEERKNYGPSFCPDGYVLHLKDGSPYHPDSITQKWNRFKAKNNIKNSRLHDLRHSCATSMVANNVDPKTVQKRLGHSSYKTTMDLYVHRTQAMDENAANIMDSIICPKN